MVVRLRELVAHCPTCLTFETLEFSRNRLLPTNRFKQNGDGRVYHDCGCDKPCRLYPRFIEEKTNVRRPVS